MKQDALKLRYLNVEDYGLDIKDGGPGRALRPGDPGYEDAPFEVGYVFLKDKEEVE